MCTFQGTRLTGESRGPKKKKHVRGSTSAGDQQVRLTSDDFVADFGLENAEMLFAWGTVVPIDDKPVL